MKGLLYIAIVACVALVVYADSVPSVNCPPYDENSTRPHLVPHPCNCNVYYICKPPANIPMSCSWGLWFNSVTKKCDYPCVAKCQLHPKCSNSKKIQNAVASQEEAGVVSQEQRGRLSAVLLP